MQHLRLTADRSTANQCSLGQSRVRIIRVRLFQPGAKDQRVTRIFTLERAGKHQPRWECCLQILEAMHGKINPPVGQCLMNFFCKQALTANFRQPPVLHLIASSVDLVFLKSVHVTQNRAKARQRGQEGARLDQRQRGATGTHAQRQGVTPRMTARFFLACGGFRGDLLQSGRKDG